MDAIVAKCRKCGEPLKEPRKLKDFCSYSCRGQHTVDTINGPAYQSGLRGSKNTRRNKALRSVKQQGVAGFSVAQINSVTYRLDQPSRRGVAYVIDVGADKPAWIARCKDQTTNPMPLNEAKVAAMAMAKGSCGDYTVTNPIAHVNGLTAILLDRTASATEGPSAGLSQDGPSRRNLSSPKPPANWRKPCSLGRDSETPQIAGPA